MGGGSYNIISGCNSSCNVLVGGRCNSIKGCSTNSSYNGVSFIGGGSFNMVTKCHSSILGGIHNTASDNYSIILGGESNSINTLYTGSSNNFIGIGYLNIITGSSYNNTIVGGTFNKISGSLCGILPSQHNFIGGGNFNTMCLHQNSNGNTIGGGYSNTIRVCSTVYCNTDYSAPGINTIGGGSSNSIYHCARHYCYLNGSEARNTISGGAVNKICFNSVSTIGGGRFNTIICNGAYNTIGGGNNNKICTTRGSSILGGCNNCMCFVTTNTNNVSNAIVGGYNNKIGMGDDCVCYNTIGGGYQNQICCCSSYNFIAGRGNCAGGGASNNGSDNSAIFGCSNRSCGAFNFVAGATNNTSTYNYVAILGTYGKTSTNNNQLMTCCICAYGSLSKASGTFTIDHPNPKKESEYNLKHSFVESPTAGDNVYRWEIDIDDTLQGEIILPEYYRYLNENSQVWVNPVDNLGRAFGIVNISATKVKITTSDPGKFNILVIGTRKDKAAVEAWKGVEVKKTKEEKLNYKNGLK